MKFDPVSVKRELGRVVGLQDDPGFLQDGLLMVCEQNVWISFDSGSGFDSEIFTAHIQLGSPAVGPVIYRELLYANHLGGQAGRMVFSLNDQAEIFMAARTGVSEFVSATDLADWIVNCTESARDFFEEASTRVSSIDANFPVVSALVQTCETRAHWKRALANLLVQEGASAQMLENERYENQLNGLTVEHCADCSALDIILDLGSALSPQSELDEAALHEHMLRLNGSLGAAGTIVFGVSSTTGQPMMRITREISSEWTAGDFLEMLDALVSFRDNLKIEFSQGS